MTYYTMSGTGSHVQVQSKSGLSVHQITFLTQIVSIFSLLRTFSTGSICISARVPLIHTQHHQFPTSADTAKGLAMFGKMMIVVIKDTCAAWMLCNQALRSQKSTT